MAGSKALDDADLPGALAGPGLHFLGAGSLWDWPNPEQFGNRNTARHGNPRPYVAMNLRKASFRHPYTKAIFGTDDSKLLRYLQGRSSGLSSSRPCPHHRKVSVRGLIPALRCDIDAVLATGAQEFMQVGRLDAGMESYRLGLRWHSRAALGKERPPVAVRPACWNVSLAARTGVSVKAFHLAGSSSSAYTTN